jgi:outer membrane lipoprotein-sorting protein
MRTGAMMVVAALWVAPSFAQESARDIMERVDRLLRGDSSHGVATMEVVTEHWERRITMELWSLGTDYSLVRIQAPAKEAGTATLMADDDIWNYLPKVDRTIKVPVSMMAGSWMGSHFTNDDLVKESQIVDDYDIEIAFDGERDGTAVWEFRLTPKADAAVVWGHVEFQVRQSDTMPLRARYFDEDGVLARTMRYTEFENLGGRTVPFVMEMQPEDKPGERTTIRYQELEFDIEIDRSFFSLQNLKRLR